MDPTIEVTIKETEPTTVAYISMKGSYDQISGCFGKLYGWIGQKGYVPSGPPIGVYFNSPREVPEEQLLWELQSPIAGETPPVGPNEEGLGVKRVPGVQVASTMYKGPFEGLADVYAAIGGWIARNGYTIAGPSQEVYYSAPAETAPADLLTEIRFAVGRI